MSNGRIEIDPEKSATVRKIFLDYSNGKSTQAIAAELTEAGTRNVSDKTTWYHGGIGKILADDKYLGADEYEQIIENDVFEQVQVRRKGYCEQYGRNHQLNSMENNKYLFSGRLHCGECGALYQKYVEGGRQKSKRALWKCKRGSQRRNGRCPCRFMTEEEIQQSFIMTVNQLLFKTWILDRKPQAGRNRISNSFTVVNQRVMELEQNYNCSLHDFCSLVYQRAAAFYETSEVDDYEYQTAKMKQLLADRVKMDAFDEELFQQIVKDMVIYKDGSCRFVFINGLQIE